MQLRLQPPTQPLDFLVNTKSKECEHPSGRPRTLTFQLDVICLTHRQISHCKHFHSNLTHAKNCDEMRVNATKRTNWCNRDCNRCLNSPQPYRVA
jgi:hypothetical protein